MFKLAHVCKSTLAGSRLQQICVSCQGNPVKRLTKMPMGCLLPGSPCLCCTTPEQLFFEAPGMGIASYGFGLCFLWCSPIRWLSVPQHWGDRACRPEAVTCHAQAASAVMRMKRSKALFSAGYIHETISGRPAHGQFTTKASQFMP